MRRTAPRWGRRCAGALLALLPLQLLGLALVSPDPGRPQSDGRSVAAGAPPRTPPPAPLGESAAPAGPVADPALATEPEAVPAPVTPAQAPPAPMLADRFPAQAAAVQDPRQPDTTRWALLIGINEHLGRVSNNIGSRQDAEDLRAHLLANGWRDDHILLLTDRDATRDAILAGIDWLAEKTDQHSVAVFHYSGHSKKWYGQDHDGDGEITDEGLWPTDDRFIVDSELVRLLDPVRPHALWLNVATCNAAGLADPGLARPGRILTFSSGEAQKSYEHPDWGNSVWGWWLIEQAMVAGRADADGDGRVTVEEAFSWARPQARTTTRGQTDGVQEAVIVDLVDGDFDLRIPGVASATPQPATASTSRPAPAPAPAASEPADAPAPTPERDAERRRSVLCVLCGSG